MAVGIGVGDSGVALGVEVRVGIRERLNGGSVVGVAVTMSGGIGVGTGN